MIGLYRLLTRLILAILYPYARLRAAGGDKLWQGRLGLLSSASPVDVWLHAASVGEVKVIGHLVRYLKKTRPGLRIHVTAMTRQGHREAAANLGDLATTSFFPLDATPAVDRVLTYLTPRIIAVAETEFWPNLILESHHRNIPLVLVNGRLSERSFGKYKLMGRSLTRLLGCYDRFFLKTAEDRDRFAHFGVPPEKSEVAGDMKFDAPLMPHSEGRVKEIRSRLGVTDEQYLLVAGSTRPGEESLLLEAYRAVGREYPHLRLAIAPRHLERVNEIKDVLDSARLNYYTYDDVARRDGVILVNRMGILNDLYLAADLAFVGGTLVNIGGHNILEPVWARTPVLFGPHLGNVSEAADYILNHNYGARVDSIDELIVLVHEAMAGKRKFDHKDEYDLRGSATAAAGDYILKRIENA